ncbi:MAG: hypothetical protein ACXVEU_17075 [Nocardioidaceae bacterium]
MDSPETAGATPGSADLAPRRQLEQSVSWSGRERLRFLWYRLRLTIAEMNYAARRQVELQARCAPDDHPGRRRAP